MAFKKHVVGAAAAMYQKQVSFNFYYGTLMSPLMMAGLPFDVY